MSFNIMPVESFLYTATTNRELYERYTLALHNCGPLGWNIANQIREYISPESKQFLRFTEKAKMDISNLMCSFSPVSHSVTGRKKGFYSFCKKLELISPAIIKDTYALRVIASSNYLGDEIAVEVCYTAAIAILDKFFHMGWKAEPLKEKADTKTLSDEIKQRIYIPKNPPTLGDYKIFIKDYIANPKPNGYQGIHLLLTDCMSGNSIEIQLRTSRMHEYAENGNASHKNYKPKTIDYSKIQIIPEEFLYDIESDTILSDIHGLIMPVPIGDNCVVQKNGDTVNWLD